MSALEGVAYTLGYPAEVGALHKYNAILGESVTDRLCRVVRNWKGQYFKRSYREGCTPRNNAALKGVWAAVIGAAVIGAAQSSALRASQNFIVSFQRALGQVDWYAVTPRKDVQTSDMVRVLMGNENGANRCWTNSYLLKPELCLLSRKPAINQHPHIVGFKKRAIGLTPT